MVSYGKGIFAVIFVFTTGSSYNVTTLQRHRTG